MNEIQVTKTNTKVHKPTLNPFFSLDIIFHFFSPSFICEYFIFDNDPMYVISNVNKCVR
jgi:hypothetical protein